MFTITFGTMRASGVRGLLIYCAICKFSHSTRIIGIGSPMGFGCPTDLELLFKCQGVRQTRCRCQVGF